MFFLLSRLLKAVLRCLLNGKSKSTLLKAIDDYLLFEALIFFCDICVQHYFSLKFQSSVADVSARPLDLS